jgi:hypothetical protein
VICTLEQVEKILATLRVAKAMLSDTCSLQWNQTNDNDVLKPARSESIRIRLWKDMAEVIWEWDGRVIIWRERGGKELWEGKINSWYKPEHCRRLIELDGDWKRLYREVWGEKRYGETFSGS